MDQPSNPNRHYQAIYKQICQEQQVHLSQAITSGLKESQLSINALLIKWQDIIPLQLLMSVCQFDSVILYGKTRKKQNKKDTLTYQELQQVINGMLNAINLNLSQPNFNLLQIQLTDLVFSPKDCQALSFGLKNTQTLKEFIIHNSNLTDQHLQILSESLQCCQSLILLDLSNNALKDTAGMIIGKIISTHAGRRDEMKWAVEIRGEDAPPSLAIQGLCEIALHSNMFDDRCVKDLCQFLMYDSWTKSIGLKDNQIGEEGIQQFNEILDTNESLISLDLRDNPGFVQPHSKEIFEKLVRNIQIFKDQKHYQETNDETPENEYATIDERQEEEEEIDCQNCLELIRHNKMLQQQVQGLQSRVRHNSQVIGTVDVSENGDLMGQIEQKMGELSLLMERLEEQKESKKGKKSKRQKHQH